MASNRPLPSGAPKVEVDDRPDVRNLLNNLKAALPELERLLADYSGHWQYEDPVYRFYHQSMKAYLLQDSTKRIVAALQELAPERKLNDYFLTIVREGTGKKFKSSDNRRWTRATRPIVEAFFHARFFLEMAVIYGKKLDDPPQSLPSGWAALLYLYELR